MTQSMSPPANSQAQKKNFLSEEPQHSSLNCGSLLNSVIDLLGLPHEQPVTGRVWVSWVFVSFQKKPDKAIQCLTPRLFLFFGVFFVLLKFGAVLSVLSGYKQLFLILF